MNLYVSYMPGPVYTVSKYVKPSRYNAYSAQRNLVATYCLFMVGGLSYDAVLSEHLQAFHTGQPVSVPG